MLLVAIPFVIPTVNVFDCTSRCPTVSAFNLVSKPQSESLLSLFRGIYGGAVHRVQSNLDRDQLGLNVEALPIIPEIGKRKKMDVALFDRVAVKWQQLMAEDESEGIVDDHCVDEEKCLVTKRLVFIMGIFSEHFLAQMVYRNDGGTSTDCLFVDLFAESLSEYDTVSLLNDFQHIKAHRVGTEQLRDCKVAGGLLRECRESTQRALAVDGDEKQEFKEYVFALDAPQRVLLEIAIRIHTFFNHSVTADRPRNEAAEPMVSKFVNEMASPQTVNAKGGETKMDGMPSILRRRHLSRSRTISFCRFINDERFDSDAMIEDLRAVLTSKTEVTSNSNLCPKLGDDHILGKKLLFHLNALNVFRFGFKRFLHWKQFERTHGDQYIKSPKFRNLKQECLQNDIFSIPIDKFNAILIKAITLWRSNKGRALKAVDVGLSNNQMEIPADSPLSISHIVVLLMYCNHTLLQNEYKKRGCRESVEMTSVDDPAFSALKDMNSEIAWWYKLITESVQFWGSRVSPKQTFFTGLNCRLLFDTLSPVFNCPFSTTVSWDVAHRFSDAQGVILKMVPSAGSWDMFFDVEWLSDFDHEKERLFVYAMALRILDIESFDLAQNRVKNGKFIRCFSLFSSLFRGHFIYPLLRKRKNKPDAMLLAMINRFKMNNEVESAVAEDGDIPISFYAEQLFNNLMDKFNAGDSKFVIKSEYKLLSMDLQRELIVFDDADNMMISPFLKSLSCSLDDIVLMEEYLWIIADEELEKFKALNAGHPMWSEEEYLFRGSDGGTVRFRMCVDRKASGSQFAGFGFEIKSTSYSSVGGRFSVNVDEVKWHYNAYRFNGLGDGGCKGTFAFEDKLVDDVTSLTIRFAVTFSGNLVKFSENK